MIPDHVYARRLVVNILLVTLGLAALAWFFPAWTPPAAAPRPACPQVWFLPRGPHDSAEQAAVWSPAMIALPGLPVRHPPKSRKDVPAPLLDSPIIPAPLPAEPSTMARPEPSRRRLMMSAAPETKSFRVQAPEMLPFPPAATRPDLEIYFEYADPAAPAFGIDHAQMDFTGLPKPEAPCAATLFLCFDDAGAVRRVLLETPTPMPELNQALVRQAYRARAIDPPAGAAPQCARLHFSFGY